MQRAPGIWRGWRRRPLGAGGRQLTCRAGSGSGLCGGAVGRRRRARARTRLDSGNGYHTLQVATWELVAAISASDTILEQWPDAEINLFMDSRTAWGTAIRGSSRQPDWSALVATIWRKAAIAGAVMAIWLGR